MSELLRVEHTEMTVGELAQLVAYRNFRVGFGASVRL